MSTTVLLSLLILSLSSSSGTRAHAADAEQSSAETAPKPDICAAAGAWSLSSFKIESPKPGSSESAERPQWLPESFVLSCPKLWGAPSLDYVDGKGAPVSVPLVGREPPKFQSTSKHARMQQVTVTAYTMRIGPDGTLTLAAIRVSRLPGQDSRPWEGHSLSSVSVTAAYRRGK